MDRMDIRLIKALQGDSRQSIAELAERIGMSSSACHRRMRALETSGVITGYVAALDPQRLGLGIQAFVEISLVDQSRNSLDQFETAVARYDDILECHLMSGNADYMLRVAAADLADFDHIHRNCLSQLPGVASMQTSFSIRPIKKWTGYPVNRLAEST